MKVSRRQFLKGGVGAAAVGAVPSVFARAARAAALEDRYLVVVQLFGGNDGLNTLIPAGIPNAGPLYYDRRPTLGVASPLPLFDSSEVGLHPGMSALASLYNSPSHPVAIVQGVGYPSQDRSHFRSQDIWGSADPVNSGPTGWLGRYLSWLYPGGSGSSLIQAVDVQSSVEILLESPGVNVITGTSPNQFDIPAPGYKGSERASQRQALKDLYAISRSGEPAFVQGVGDAVNTNVEDFAAIATEPPDYVSMGSYNTSDGFHRKLQFAAQTILHRDSGGQRLAPRVMHLGQGGFDTHSDQEAGGYHGNLLGRISSGLVAFYDDMVGHGAGDEVTVLTVSEFGRTTEENGSNGSDHGAASLLFVMGEDVQGGLHGTHPSLEEADLDSSGDLVYTVDFRQVYNTVLADWLGVPGPDRDALLGGSFGTLGLF